jgi:hypothetical protein
MLVNHVSAFTVEVRERQGLDKELVVFDAPYSEGRPFRRPDLR